MMKRLESLDIILIALIILILLVVFTFAIALAFPQATQRILKDLRARAQAILGPEFLARPPAFLEAVQKRAGEGFKYRIKPFFLRGINFFYHPYSTMLSRLKAERERREKELAFKKCLSCHKDLFKRTALRSIYIDHLVHKRKGVSCEKCHIEIKHPQPPRPKERLCLDCHQKVGAPDKCKDCHAPGSIFHSAIVAPEKTAQFMGERVLISLVPPGFERGRSEACGKCHEIKNFCDRCHLVFHKDDPNWRPTHGPRIMKGELMMRVS